MRCRKNIRKLIQEYNAASPADKPDTALMRFRQALVALKAAPSRLGPPHTQASRYDDYVYVHQQSMAGHGISDPGPHSGHKGPLFFPWHRELLRQFENDLRDVSGDPAMCLPYWDFTRDQAPADPGYPFFDELLGGDGTGPGDRVETGVFALANGWTLTLGDSEALLRNLGGGAPSLPSHAAAVNALSRPTYDVAPWNRSASAADSFRNLVEGWVGPEIGTNLHNRVHVWVGGSMGPSTSPNDPVFFLNHAKEDELWAVWMQKHPTVDHYLPRDSEPLPAGHTHLKRLSDHMESLAEYFGAGTIDRPIDLLDHKAITWYDTDLPEIVLESGPALGFTNMLADSTVGQLARFRIQTPRPVTFSVTGMPTGNFSVVGGPDFTVVPVEANDFETLEIEVRFHAVGADVQVSAIELEARIVDDEGYYAANPGDPFTVARFRIELVASDIVTSDSSIALVLDRSGSMLDVANGGRTKHELLLSAVGVVHSLMQDTDEIGIARFDHEADVLLPMTPRSAGLGTTLTGSGLDPRGATSVGAGLLVGSGLLHGPGATRPNRALIVLTDGNENTHPLIRDLPAGTIDQTTFAIGFGLPGQVSDPILAEISANSGGYLLVTGDLSSDAEQFALAKYFIQILKDATLNQTITDPAGLLPWGGRDQEISFQVADSDISLDVVLLCPLPSAVDFRLVTPSGAIIEPAMSGIEPNVRYVEDREVCYHRLKLPALLGNPGGTHRGTWKARLRLRPFEEVVARLRAAKHDREKVQEILRKLKALDGKPLPFNLTAHSFSNLTLDATLRQSGFAPGATVQLTATPWEYRLPLRADSTVWADVVTPSGARSVLPMPRSSDGSYRASWVTDRPGVYRFLIHAQGQTSGQARFTREKLLTASVWAGGDRPYDPRPERGGECGWMLCLLEQAAKSKELHRHLDALGLDLGALRRCLARHCRPDRVLERPRTIVRAPADAWRELLDTPDFRRMVATLASAGPGGAPRLEAPKPRAVTRKPRLKGSNENMFLTPDQLKQLRDKPRK